MRDMRRSLQQFDEQGRRIHIDGAKLARLHAAQYAGLQKEMKEATRTVKEFLGPTFAALGIGSISAGAALGGLTKSIIDFGAAAKHLTFLRTIRLIFSHAYPRAGKGYACEHRVSPD
jgi:hypothetical protein